LLEEAGFAERFRGEARTMATINHPGVVDVYDYGSDRSLAYLVMEYVEGDALSRTLARVGRLTPARTMALVAQAADALQAAHDQGIVHRDVKPGNLLVRPNGTLVLTDFGIARSAMVGQLTAAGSVLGTASYISPEQAAGSVATAASDVYSLGVVAYQCLAGHRPFEGENPLEIALKHVRDVPRPLPGDIPPVVRSIVERAMSKDPAARWPTAATLAAVARQAAATLAASGAPRAGQAAKPTSGAPMSPGPVSPMSPGPMSAGSPGPMSPGPVSPGVPVAPMSSPAQVGPTRMMPGSGPGPHGPAGVAGAPWGPAASAPPGPGGAPRAAPGSPAPVGPGGLPRGAPGSVPPVSPGGFARGAAMVPQSRPAGHAFGYTPPTGYPHAGTAGAQPARRGSGLLVFTVLTAAVAILLCAGLLTYFGRQAGLFGQGSGGRGGQSNSPSSAPAQLVTLPCDHLKRATLREARAALENLGMRPRTVPTPGGRAGNIHDISPCTATAGSEVTITVRTGTNSTVGPYSTCNVPGGPFCLPGGGDD
ncbi:MAG TPA: protein kinase, partial [Micromonosporaceae bacterium]|nr:protein kinase [Micromonosporaceae bacterium]